MKAALLFAGQGAQCPGMAADICSKYPEAAKIFDEASAVLGRSVADIAWKADAQTLNLTENTQPAMFTAELAIFAVLKERVCPAFAAGFSLGEWAALTAANVLTFAEAIKLVQLRAHAMQRAVPVGMGGMAVVLGHDAGFVAALCRRVGKGVSPSNYNCPGQVSVAGTAAGIDAFLDIAAAEGIAAQRLPVSIPSHCALMQPAAEELSDALLRTAFAAPAYPVVMNVTARGETEAGRIRENLLAQLTHPVRFEESLGYMFDAGVDTFIEIGPGKTLSGFLRKLAKKMGREVAALSAADLKSLHTTIESLKKGMMNG